MEIKINCHLIEDHSIGGRTSLFEGTNITHRFIRYESIFDFIEKYNNYTKEKKGWVIGVPDSYWKDCERKDKIEEFFLLVNFNDENGDFIFLVIKNSTLFVTSKGQTIDKIIA